MKSRQGLRIETIYCCEACSCSVDPHDYTVKSCFAFVGKLFKTFREKFLYRKVDLERLVSDDKATSAYLATLFLNRDNANLFDGLAQERVGSLL
jgi:hypothetical protein